jgi:RHH-type proline utilization regulon transcriptional repressor/proline dehydrogenase/delta 1-pyrroline-5-carboxylate dehydrogenase
MDGVMEPAMLTGLVGIDAVASQAGETTLRAIRQALAARGGALITLFTENGQPELYTLVRHVCVDSTAEGGNASLLAEAGSA